LRNARNTLQMLWVRGHLSTQVVPLLAVGVNHRGGAAGAAVEGGTLHAGRTDMRVVVVAREDDKQHVQIWQQKQQSHNHELTMGSICVQDTKLPRSWCGIAFSPRAAAASSSPLFSCSEPMAT
jgi:hypothetical protein